MLPVPTSLDANNQQYLSARIKRISARQLMMFINKQTGVWLSNWLHKQETQTVDHIWRIDEAFVANLHNKATKIQHIVTTPISCICPFNMHSMLNIQKKEDRCNLLVSKALKPTSSGNALLLYVRLKARQEVSECVRQQERWQCLRHVGVC